MEQLKNKNNTVENAIKRMLILQWPEYYSHQKFKNIYDKYAQPPAPTAEYTGPDKEIGLLKSFSYERQACETLAQELCDGPFAACNPKVAAAVKMGLLNGISVLSEAHEIQNEDSEADTSAFISLQAMRATLASACVMFGVRDYQDVYSNDDVLVKQFLQNSSRKRDGTISQKYAFDLGAINDYADNDGYDDLRIPGYFTAAVTPGHRVNFESSFVPKSLNHEFRSSVNHRGKFSFESFSLRIDEDTASATGFSLDIGRDARNSDTFARTADAPGESLQLVRPENDEGSHFTDTFDSVTDQDFKDFTDNIRMMLLASIEMSEYDSRLKKMQRLGDQAVREFDLR